MRDGLNNCQSPFGSNRHIAKQEHQRDSDNEECDLVRSMAKDFDSCVDFGLIYTAFDVTFVEGPSSQALIQSALRECGVMHKVIPRVRSPTYLCSFARGSCLPS